MGSRRAAAAGRVVALERGKLQADCLAGATIFGAEEDGLLTFGEDVQQDIVNGLNLSADDTAWTDSDDHSDPFERIEACNKGRTAGVQGCLPGLTAS